MNLNQNDSARVATNGLIRVAGATNLDIKVTSANSDFDATSRVRTKIIGAEDTIVDSKVFSTLENNGLAVASALVQKFWVLFHMTTGVFKYRKIDSDTGKPIGTSIKITKAKKNRL